MIKKLLLFLFGALLLEAQSLPLEGKKYGVEFNIPRLLTYSDSWKSVSGTFSYFNQKKKVEFAFLGYMAFYKDSGFKIDEEHYDVYNIDFHYRQFLGEEMNGVYLSGFTRFSYLNGILEEENRYKKTPKFGLGVGVGYRVFPKTQRYYWGFGLIVGRYIIGQNDIYREVGFSIEDMPYIIDVEFLKFGYAF